MRSCGTWVGDTMGSQVWGRMTAAVVVRLSAQALLEHPDLVADIHRDYIEAGRYPQEDNGGQTMKALVKEGRKPVFDD